MKSLLKRLSKRGRKPRRRVYANAPVAVAGPGWVVTMTEEIAA